jgi:hypothetical protein
MKLASGYDRKKHKDQKEYRHLTKAEILALPSGGHAQFIDRFGTVRDCKINGRVRTWKRDPTHVEVPIKIGLYEYATLNLQDALTMFVKEVDA